MPATITEMRFKVAFSGGWLLCPGFNPCYNGSVGKPLTNLIVFQSLLLW